MEAGHSPYPTTLEPILQRNLAQNLTLHWNVADMIPGLSQILFLEFCLQQLAVGQNWLVRVSSHLTLSYIYE